MKTRFLITALIALVVPIHAAVYQPGGGGGTGVSGGLSNAYSFSAGFNVTQATNVALNPTLSNIVSTGVSPGATNAGFYVGSSSGKGTNTQLFVSATVSGRFETTNGVVVFGDINNPSVMTNYNQFWMRAQMIVNDSGLSIAIRDGAFLDFRNGSVIILGSDSTTNWIQSGPNSYLSSPVGGSDNNEIYRYRFWGDGGISALASNRVMRFWELSNYVSTVSGVASNGVLVNTGNILFVRTNGNNATAIRGRMDRPWALPHAANSNAITGDIIDVGSGQFDIGTNDMKLPIGITLRGAGENLTRIISQAVLFTNGPVISVNSSNLVQDLEISLTNSAVSYQAGIGTIYSLGGKAPTNTVIRRVRIVNGESDSVYFQHTNYMSVFFYDCEFQSKWDVFVQDGAVNTSTNYFEVWNTKITSDRRGALFVSAQTANSAIGVRLSHGTLHLFNCSIVVTNANTCYGISLQGFPFQSAYVHGGSIIAAGTNSVWKAENVTFTVDPGADAPMFFDHVDVLPRDLKTDSVGTWLGGAFGTFYLPQLATNSIPYIGGNGLVSTASLSGLTLSGGVLTSSGGGGTPAGNSGAVQFNEGGAFAGTNSFIADRTNNVFRVRAPSGMPGISIELPGVGSNTFGFRQLTYNPGTGNTYDFLPDVNASGGFGLTSLGSIQPVTSNFMSAGTFLRPFSTNYANDFVAFETISTPFLSLTGNTNGSASFYDSAGTEYAQLVAINNIQTNSVHQLWTNATSGVVVAQPAGTGTNQLQNIALTAGQVVTFDGTKYIATVPNNAVFTAYSMVTGSPTTNIIIDASLGTLFRVLLTNSSAGLLITNGIDGQELSIELYQDGTGNRTVTHVPNTGGVLTNNWQFGEDITSPLTLSTNQYKKDLLKLRYEVTNLATNTSRSNWCVIGMLHKYPNP